ncbi:hypothetical protein EC991_003298 [Linnemannia zychae]|nr:hypothetical protein EC991_003298 [Linnemannia zychae]
MKISLAFAALVALASTAASAAPTNSTLRDRYHDWIKARPTTGNAKTNYKETRTSTDKLWSVTHTGRAIDNVVLKVKGKTYTFVWPGDPEKGGKYENNSYIMEYWHCVAWDQ